MPPPVPSSHTLADWARVAMAIAADLQSGVVHDLRAKALQLLPSLPPHRLVALLSEPALAERIVVAIRLQSDAVRSAALTAASELTSLPQVLAAAAAQPALQAVLGDLWSAAGEALTDESALVAAAACSAVARLLGAGRTTAAMAEDEEAAGDAAGAAAAAVPVTEEGEGGDGDGTGSGRGVAGAGPYATGSSVLRGLIEIVQERLFGQLGASLARLRLLPTPLLLQVPPMLVAHLRLLQQAPGSRSLDALPGDAGHNAADSYSFEESASFLSGMLCSSNAAVVLAAAEALLNISKVSGWGWKQGNYILVQLRNPLCGLPTSIALPERFPHTHKHTHTDNPVSWCRWMAPLQPFRPPFQGLSLPCWLLPPPPPPPVPPWPSRQCSPSSSQTSRRCPRCSRSSSSTGSCPS
jgi:hypothetical protein